METTPLALTTLRDRGLGFLKNQARDGFQESLDIQLGLHGHPLLIASVFPISILVMALLEVNPHDTAIEPIARREVSTLVALGEEGGWRYFNLCPETPPDADDLAQVIRVGRRLDMLPLSRLAGPLARLERNRVAAGRYRTWLGESPEEQARADAMWAPGVDPVFPEVNANILFSLIELDPARYAGEAIAGAVWLVDQAEKNGLWASVSYYGEAYGTYQVLRLMAALTEVPAAFRERLATAVRRARSSLLSLQQRSGGWASRTSPVGVRASGTGDAMPAATGILETAHAILALSCLASDPEIARAIERGLSFLCAAQAADGGFAADPFYYTIGLVPYGSRCITTAAVMTATVSARRQKTG